MDIISVDSFERQWQPYQKDLYRKLLLIGPGPAEMYKDACWVWINKNSLSAAGSIISHLFREVESALGDLLWGVIGNHATLRSINNKKLKNKEAQITHREKIYSICEKLGIDEKNDHINFWFENLGLHKFVHRNSLQMPNNSYLEMNDHFRKIESLFIFLLENYESNYLKTFEKADQLLAIEDPNKENFQEFKQLMPHGSVGLFYFFKNLKHEKWFKHLKDSHYFDDFPHNPLDEDGRSNYIDWPQSFYLMKMVSNFPDEILDILLKLPIPANPYHTLRYIEVANAIPEGLTAKLTHRFNEIINNSNLFWSENALIELIERQLKSDQCKSGIQIAEILFELLPDPQSQEQSVKTVEYTFLDPKARFDPWYYKESIRKLLPSFIDKTKLDGFSLFCRLLNKAVQLTRDESDPNTLLYAGPLEIEDREKNWHGTTPKDQLFYAVREIALALFPEFKKKVLDEIEQYGEIVFLRINLFIRARYPEIDPEGSSRLFLEKKLHENYECSYDLRKFLEKCFSNLSTEAQDKYFETIDSGFNETKWIEFHRELNQQEITKHEMENDRKRWKYEKYIPIQKYLKDNRKIEFENLKQEFEQQAQTQKINQFKGTRAAEPAIRVDLETIHKMDIDEFLEHLKTLASYSKSERMMIHARQIEQLVADMPDRYANDADKLLIVDTVTVHGFFRGWFDAIQNKNPFNPEHWPKIIKLCKSALSLILDPQNENATDYEKGTLKSIINLIRAGLIDQACLISNTESETILYILKTLSEYPDPEFHHKSSRRYEPMMEAINSIRPEALDSIIFYANWIYNHRGQDDNNILNDLPDLIEVLENRLDPNYEDADAVHLIFGKRLPYLCKLGDTWTRNHLVKIFGPVDQFSDKGTIAWSAYLKYNRSYLSVFPILSDYYRLAIENIGTIKESDSIYASTEQRLAEHLSILYTLGCIDLDEPENLVHVFFQTADMDLRSRFLKTPIFSLDQTEGVIETSIINRLKKVWEWRLNTIEQHTDKSDFISEVQAFGPWFACDKFADEKLWRITHLINALKIHGEPELPDSVAETLEEFSDEFPNQAIEALLLMTAGTEDYWQIELWKNHVEPIIKQAMTKTAGAVKYPALEILNQLGRKGFLEFRELAGWVEAN